MRQIILCLVLLAVTACSESEQPPHLGRGVVLEVNIAENQVVLDHQEIPGVMKAMTMGFDVASPALLQGLKPGPPVDFELIYDERRYLVSAVRPQ